MLYNSSPREPIPIRCIYIDGINLLGRCTLAFLDCLDLIPDSNERCPVFLGCLDPSWVRCDRGRALLLEVLLVSPECMLQWGAVSEVVGPGVNQ
jgi:hypothetical protein